LAGKSLDVALVGQHGATRSSVVTTSATGATRSTRAQRRCHRLDWGGCVHLTFSRSCCWDWCKSSAQKTKLVHASTAASSSSVVLEQARRDTHDAHDTSRHNTHDTSCVLCRDVSWRDV